MIESVPALTGVITPDAAPIVATPTVTLVHAPPVGVPV